MKQILILSVVLAFVLYSCADDTLTENNTPEKTALMNIQSVAIANECKTLRSGIVNEFQDNDTIGLYLSDYHFGPPHLYVFRESYWWWNTSVPVLLAAEPLRLHAYYPYRYKEHTYLDDSYIDVEHISQTDYMHGQAASGEVFWSSPDTHLLMEHALALIEFRFIKNDYPGNGIIQKVSVRNADGIFHLHSQGRMNIEYGAIEPVIGHYEPASIIPENKQISEDYTSEKDYVRILVMPTKPTRADGDLLFEFEIDGRIYTYPLPSGCSWQQGMKYTYEMEMIPAASTLKSSIISANIRVALTKTRKQ